MIISVGIDIIETDEIKRSIIKSKRFVERVFTETERNYCESKENKFQHYAVRFAAKEAVMKALGIGWDKGVQWDQIKIYNNSEGKVEIKLAGKAYEIMQKLNVDNIFVSLSHSQQNAIAMVILEGHIDEEIHY